MLPVEKLRPSPLQLDTFSSCNAAEDAALRADLRDRGQRDPVHVMPPGNAAGWPDFSILDGHRRVEQMKQLGFKEVAAVVRHELVNSTSAEVEAIFLTFNTIRRQLHPLDRAALGIRQFELEKGKPRGSIRLSFDENAARDRVGKLLGWSGRHLHRMFRILLTPRPVQRAVRDGFLPVLLAEKVEALPDDVQAEIARRIEECPADAKKIVSEHIRHRAGRHEKVTDAMAAFIRACEVGLADLDGRLSQVSATTAARHLPTLDKVEAVIKKLRRQARGADEERKRLNVLPKSLPDTHRGGA